jgi:hypothetical protein
MAQGLESGLEQGFALGRMDVNGRCEVLEPRAISSAQLKAAE